jgi:hypothetical protein
MICSDNKPLAFQIRTLLYDSPNDSETFFLRSGVVTFRLLQTSTPIAYWLQLLFDLLLEETTVNLVLRGVGIERIDLGREVVRE